MDMARRRIIPDGSMGNLWQKHGISKQRTFRA